MPFLPLSSKTWTHLEIFSRLGRPSSEIFFSRLGIPSFEMYIFCNTMSPSLDNDCAIQDLAFQVLKLFGAKNFNIRPLPRIMSFMTWSSKTWTQVNMIVKTWQPQQFWNLTFFFQDLAISHVLNCYFFESPCPQDLTMIALFKTWLSKSWNFRVKTFNIRPLPRIMSFMTWSSKTWTHLEIFFQDLAATVLKSYIFSRLWTQVLKCYIFLQPHVPKSWQWLHYSRLGFPSLETFRGKELQH